MTDPVSRTTQYRYRTAQSLDDVRRGGDLGLRDQGPAVREVQRRLIDLGFLPREHEGRSNVDGYFGDRTRDALKAFQAVNGLIERLDSPNAGRMDIPTYDKLFLPGPVVATANPVSGLRNTQAENQRIQNRLEEQQRDRYSTRPEIAPLPERAAPEYRGFFDSIERDASRAGAELEGRPWSVNDLGYRSRSERVQFGRERLRQLEDRLLSRNPGVGQADVTRAQSAIRSLRERYDELDSVRWFFSTPDQRVRSATDTSRLEREVIRSTAPGVAR